MIAFAASLVFAGHWMGGTQPSAWTERWGTESATLPVPGGAVIVYMPSDVRPGETVSGSVFAQVSGDDPNRDLNAAAIAQYDLFVDGNRSPVGLSGFTLKTGQASVQFSVQVAGKEVARTEMPLASGFANRSAGFRTNPIAQCNGVVAISGAFDGDRSNTFIDFDGRSVGVLAESPRQCFVVPPANETGRHTVNVHENGAEFSVKVNLLYLTVMAPSHSIVSGAKDTIGIAVDGLEGLEASDYPVFVRLENHDPGIMRYAATELPIIDIPIPKDRVSEGHFLGTVPIVGKAAGRFSVTSTLRTDSGR